MTRKTKAECALCISGFADAASEMRLMGASVAEVAVHCGVDVVCAESHFARCVVAPEAEGEDAAPTRLSAAKLQKLVDDSERIARQAEAIGNLNAASAANGVRLRGIQEQHRRSEIQQAKAADELSRNPQTWTEKEKSRLIDFFDQMIAEGEKWLGDETLKRDRARVNSSIAMCRQNGWRLNTDTVKTARERGWEIPNDVAPSSEIPGVKSE